MADFLQVRRFLEAQRTDLARAVADPAFEREFGNLQRMWDTDDDPAYKLEETYNVMRKYPPVWDALVGEGLVDGLAPDDPPGPSVPSPLGRPLPARSVPSDRSDQPPTHTLMNQPSLSPSTLDRLALWDKKISIAKEIVTGLMGVIIIGMTLLVAWRIASMEEGTALESAKDVLLFLNGLVGVVLGYYFGRVPGEIRADKAESEANAARSDLESMVTEVDEIMADSSAAGSRSSAGGMALSPAQVERLRAMRRRVRR